MDKEPIVITDTEINLSINVMMDEKTTKSRTWCWAKNSNCNDLPWIQPTTTCIRAASKCTFELSPPDIFDRINSLHTWKLFIFFSNGL
jgi:hypothetical protein